MDVTRRIGKRKGGSRTGPLRRRTSCRGGVGQRICPPSYGGRLFDGKNGGRDGSPHPRGQGKGGRIPNPPQCGSHRTSRRRATTGVAPTEGGMGSCIREDDGRGRAVRDLPLRGSHRTRRRRATTRVAPTEIGFDGEWGRAGLKPAPTEKGLSVGGVGKMGLRHLRGHGRGTGGSRTAGMRESSNTTETGMDSRGCGKNGGRDGSPHARGHGEGTGGF